MNMSNSEAENISKHLRTNEIQLPSNNKWLLDCINWYKAHPELRNIYHSLQDYVCIQWLLSDLRDVQHRSLPTNLKNGIVEVTGKHCVQVNWVRDISQPCYTQLQAIKNNNIADSNENVTAEETRKQNWEPSPKRVLMMEITDGFTTLKAMEYSPIPRLTEPFIPGFKVVLSGPIECRKGILFLKANNVNILGGEVDYMCDMYSKENLLSRCLNIIPPDNNNSDSRRNISPVSYVPQHSPPRADYDRPQPPFNDVDQLPDSTSFIDNHPFEDNHDAMMAEDDDDLFCQLPDTMFNDVENFDQQPNRLSPVLDEGPAEEVQSSTLENIPEETHPLPNRAKNINRPKLFPSMEDLRPEKELSSNTKQSTLPALGRSPIESRTTPNINNPNAFKSTNAVSRNKDLCGKQAEPHGSAANVRVSTVTEQRSMEHTTTHHNLDDSISNHIDNALDDADNENIYPQFKRVKVRVLSITKLKIRNGEWTCCASVSLEEKTETVTFCNKLLEKIFGTSATEVEVLRSEMSKNQSLKEKVNDILKLGQTKLKLLNGLMIVEYTSEGCTPNIVSIHED